MTRMMLRLTIGFLLPVCAAMAQDGRQVFSTHCQVCHGDGHGTERGPNLANNRRVQAQSAEQLRALIREGLPATGMPPFDLPRAQLDAVTSFVRSLSASAIDVPAEGDRAAGERTFFGKGGCARCHMVLGKGQAVGPDLSALGRELSVQEIRQAVLRPSAAIKPGYEVVNLRLASGGTLRGFARNQSLYNMQVQDFDGRFHLLAASEFTVTKREDKSLMPAPACGDDECRDLVAYLSSLGGADLETEPFPFPSSGGLSFDQVARPASGDWTTYHGLIGGNRHSGLDQINAANVKDLRLEWVFPINHFVIEATPLVVDGVMYVTGPNQVFALDARAGRTIWHYQRPRSSGVRGDPAKGTNRGVAVLGDRVFMVTNDARLIALHRVSGQLLWETDITAGLDKQHYGNTSAPLVVNDLVVAGISGGDLGVRGFLSAFKADTGEQVWRFWTVPKPGEPLSETWRGTALAEHGGGGATWMTGTYDPETDTVFWGVGNPYPAMDGGERLGDNLYTGSVLALDARSGHLKWYYQFTPHDLYDWDGGQTPMVLNARYRGRNRQLLIQANRNGFFYVFDRTDGELLLAEKFADKVSWATGIGDHGRPLLVPGMKPEPGGTKVCPNVLGAANWPSVAFHPGTKLFYVNAREACGIYSRPPRWNRRPIPLEPGQMFLRAIDIETGERVWELPQIGAADSWGGVLSTAGGLVFFGEDSGALGAADARTGKSLWHVQTNASTKLGDGHSWRASPMTYMAGGKQHVAVAAGPNILSFRLP
jgi:PQQ-dependent dehydrogenase (methanol/ethanol family)